MKCSLPAFLLVCILTGWIGLGYVVGNAVRTLSPGLAARKEQTYYDYTRRQRKYPVFGAFLITGGVDLLIAVGLLAAYLRL